MRLQTVRTSVFYFYTRTVTKDGEGVPVVTYGEPFTATGYMWNATSARQIERYGDKIASVSNMRLAGDWHITVGDDGVLCATEQDGRVIRLSDGLSVYRQDAPDYDVRALSSYDGTLLLEVERRG